MGIAGGQTAMVANGSHAIARWPHVSHYRCVGLKVAQGRFPKVWFSGCKRST